VLIVICIAIAKVITKVKNEMSDLLKFIETE